MAIDVDGDKERERETDRQTDRQTDRERLLVQVQFRMTSTVLHCNEIKIKKPTKQAYDTTKRRCLNFRQTVLKIFPPCLSVQVVNSPTPFLPFDFSPSPNIRDNTVHSRL